MYNAPCIDMQYKQFLATRDLKISVDVYSDTCGSVKESIFMRLEGIAQTITCT